LSRTFDGDDDYIQLSTGALATVDGGPLTVAAIVRARSTVGATVYAGTSPTSVRWSCELFGGTWFVSNNGGVASMFAVRDDEWVLIAHTKADGSVVPREHEYRYATETWAHADTGASVPDGGAPGVGGAIVLGRWESDFLAGELVAAAVWDRELSDGDLEALTDSLAAWEASTPTALWALNQADVGDPVEDLTGGGADQSVIVGTAVSAEEPPGWSYGGAVDAVMAAVAPAATSSTTAASRSDAALAGTAAAAAASLSAGARTDAVLAGAAAAAVGSFSTGGSLVVRPDTGLVVRPDTGIVVRP
jgi:hypothetical protein